MINSSGNNRDKTKDLESKSSIEINKPAKRSNMAVWAVVIFIVIAGLGFLAFKLMLPGVLIAQAAQIPASSASAAETIPAATPKVTMTQEQAQPTASPSPTPTADPNDIYFAKSGEEITENPDKTEWLYRSANLYIHIKKYDNNDLKLHYFVSDIRTRGDMIFKSAFSDEKRPGTNAMLPSLVAKKLNAVYLQNGDYFEDKRSPRGVVIRHGIVYWDDKKADTLAIIPDGTLKVYSGGEINAAGLSALGVSDTFSFGPILIRDGVINPDLSKAHLERANPRNGIGMIEKGHYIGIVVEGRNPKDNRGITLEEYAKMFADQGCTVAYNLDGGASSAMVFMGDTLNLSTNVLTTKTYRRVPDVLIIGISDAVSAVN